MRSVIFAALAFAATVMAAPTPAIIPVGPVTWDQMAYEYKLTAGKGCDGGDYALGETGPVYDFTKPSGYEYPELCSAGYVLFQKRADGWYMISGDRLCVDRPTKEAKLQYMLEKYAGCPATGAGIAPEPTATSAAFLFDMLDELLLD